MAFDAFRENGEPTDYESVRIPWEVDLVTSGLIFSFVILALSFYLILPGLVGKDKLFSFIRITVSLYIGAVILVTNFSMTWDTAKTHTTTKYKAGSGQEVEVEVGVSIGFRGINITLEGDKNEIKGETINYNENFNWEGLQGRQGFGPFAGHFNKDFRAAQLRGIPLPILWVAEYFTIDGEGIRWGRFYRQAGWYSHIILWLAFPLWILSNILFCILLRYGAYFLALTGLSMITSNIIWATLRNSFDLKIPLTTHDVLEFSFGNAFWVCLITGILCVVLGIAVFLVDKLCPKYAAIFFGVDILQDSENIIVEEEDDDISIADDDQRAHTSDKNRSEAIEEEEEYTTAQHKPADKDKLPVPDAARPYIMNPLARKRSYRTSEHKLTKKLQRPRRRDFQHRFSYDASSDGYYISAPPRHQELREKATKIVTLAGSTVDDDHSTNKNATTIEQQELRENTPKIITIAGNPVDPVNSMNKEVTTIEMTAI